MNVPLSRLCRNNLTPDHFIVLVLGLVGFLVVSDWFEWFAFNRHKGWAVLIAVATVRLAMILLVSWFLGSLLLRLRFQFHLRTLFLITIIVALTLGRLAAVSKNVNSQRKAVDEIRSVGGLVYYDFCPNQLDCRLPDARLPAPRWLLRSLGDDWFGDVISVSFYFASATRIVTHGYDTTKKCGSWREKVSRSTIPGCKA